MKYFKNILLVIIILIPLKISADDPDILSLKPSSLGKLTYVHDYMDRIGDYGERIVVWNIRDQSSDAYDNLHLSLGITYYPKDQVFGDFQSNEKMLSNAGAKTHTVANWTVGLISSSDASIGYHCTKGRFGVGVSVINAASSTEAKKYADMAFKYVLPKIPTPPSSEFRADLDADLIIDPKGNPIIKPKSEYDVQREKAFKEFEETTAKYVEAENKKVAALNELYTKGEEVAGKENFSISSNVSIIPPRKKLAIYREVDHEFGVTIKNNSDYDISKVKISIYANTKKGKEKLDSRKISFIQKNNSGSTIFRISHRKLWGLLDDFVVLGTDLEIKADYKIKWNKSYFSSESVTAGWNEAINPSEKGTDIYTDPSIEIPPIGSIQLVDDRNQKLNDNEIVAGNTTLIKFSLSKDSRGDENYLITYGKPIFSIKPNEALYSKGMNKFNLINPSSHDITRKKFHKQKHFSGEFTSNEITFFGYVEFPHTKNDQEVQITLPIKYSYELNQVDNEKYWNSITVSAKFKLIPPRAELDISDVLECNVREVSRETQSKYGLTLPGGQIATYSGDIIWVQPTDRWWDKDYEDWVEANDRLLAGEGYENPLEKGGEIFVGEVIGEYEGELWGTVSTIFSVEKIVQAQNEEEITKETIKVIAGKVVPFSSVMVPLIEKANAWKNRNKTEEDILTTGLNKGANKKFEKGTLFRNESDDYGNRIFYKIINDKMYAIHLGPSNI